MTQPVRRGLGWRPDPPKLPGQTPDYDAARYLATRPLAGSPLPVAASNRDLVTRILDQGQLGSCTANAVAYAIRAAMLLAGVHDPEFLARLFLYFAARAKTGDEREDTGTYLRLILEMAEKLGFPPESLWPYSDDTSPGAPAFTKPSDAAFRAAFDQRVPRGFAYHRIYETGYARVDAVKRAIAERHLVVFGTDVTEAFCSGDFDPTKPVDPPTSTDKIAGGHAMALAEYSGDAFGNPGSWGELFGVGGWVRFSADYIASPRSTDFWIVERAPLFSEAA